MNISVKEWFAFVVLVLILTNLSIILNIPYLRQIFGFFFLTILPGLLLVQILKLNKVDFLGKFVILWGLSISFLMFFGLLINSLSLSVGYKTPLMTNLLLISFNLAFIVLAIIGYKINKEPLFSLSNLNLSTSEKAFLIVPILFPALSILGMYVMNTTDNNTVLMFLLFLIPIYVAFVTFFNQAFPKRLYPIVIFLIGISLLLLLALRSNHILGVDIHKEYYYFLTTFDNLHWGIIGRSTLDACLSISLLPIIYQTFLNVNNEYLYKILYSLIFSIFPLAVYVLSKKYVEEGYAFLASCFSMFQVYFLWIAFNPRTSVAVLFFALAMVSLFIDGISPQKKRILLITFMASCVVSHYATTYAFFFILLGAFIGVEVVSKRYIFKHIMSLTGVVLFFVLTFFWYSQITKAAFGSGVDFIEQTLINLHMFFLEESRSSGVSSLMGSGSARKGITYMIEFVFTWLTFVFIAIGLITLLIRYKEMIFLKGYFKKPDFLKKKFEVEYLMIALGCAFLLVIMLALPYISVGYEMTRLYALTIAILSVFFVIGGIVISNVLNHLIAVFRGKTLKKSTTKVWAYLIILLVLIPYFLCVTDVTYNMAGVTRSILLNSEGAHYNSIYLHDQESYGAKWLKENGEPTYEIYADFRGRLILASQSKFSFHSSNPIPKTMRIEKGYIYLRYYDIIVSEFLSEYPHRFVGKSVIYDNMGSKIYIT